MLEINNLTKIFYKGTPNENTAVKNINLDVKNGDFITIVGSNGAGKSTLLNSIAGVFPVDKGRIILDDQDITKKCEYKCAQNIGRVFQNPLAGTSPEMTIEENLSLAISKSKNISLRWGLTKSKRKRMRDHLEKIDLGLEKRLTTKVKLLSGGQRQALTLLMATVANPSLLLLDEHTAALDPATAIKIKNLTSELVNENNITTLMITHNMEDAIKLGNRLIMMDGGEVIYDIKKEEKENLTIEKLMKMFEVKHGGKFTNDRMLLSV
ncbi:ABC transporter ATP-binding protein [Halanaerobium hydrogeniformans]|uniref:ABC transporter related protein n=1 Tax=Halanaerobium hydrogeniformans TaxID=656519 RepID=E4RIT9_HALHG|nr:ATP-binding cassette domain-containing protein [Halanaerobium hydrogeniformans]ADQ15159.1 ABC transporter related protein [Halanaerobium hydrogeniformans]